MNDPIYEQQIRALKKYMDEILGDNYTKEEASKILYFVENLLLLKDGKTKIEEKD